MASWSTFPWSPSSESYIACCRFFSKHFTSSDSDSDFDFGGALSSDPDVIIEEFTTMLTFREIICINHWCVGVND